MDRNDFAVQPDQMADLAFKAFGDLFHATDRLKNRRLVVGGKATFEARPQARLQHAGQSGGFGGFGHGAEAAAGAFGKAAPFGRWRAFGIAQVLIERAPTAQRLQQDFGVVLGYGIAQCVLVHRFGQQFAGVAHEIGLDFLEALRFAAERSGVVQIGVGVDLHEGFERDAEC